MYTTIFAGDKLMKRKTTIFVLIFILIIFSAELTFSKALRGSLRNSVLNEAISAKAISVLSGNKVLIRSKGKKIKLHLIGIVPPVENYKYTIRMIKRKVLNKRVHYIPIIKIDKRNVAGFLYYANCRYLLNATLIKRGAAILGHKYPNRFRQEFVRLLDWAQRHKQGFWKYKKKWVDEKSPQFKQKSFAELTLNEEGYSPDILYLGTGNNYVTITNTLNRPCGLAIFPKDKEKDDFLSWVGSFVIYPMEILQVNITLDRGIYHFYDPLNNSKVQNLYVGTDNSKPSNEIEIFRPESREMLNDEDISIFKKDKPITKTYETVNEDWLLHDNSKKIVVEGNQTKLRVPKVKSTGNYEKDFHLILAGIVKILEDNQYSPRIAAKKLKAFLHNHRSLIKDIQNSVGNIEKKMANKKLNDKERFSLMIDNFGKIISYAMKLSSDKAFVEEMENVKMLFKTK